MKFLLKECELDATEGLVYCIYAGGSTADLVIKLLVNEFGAKPNARVVDVIGGAVPLLHRVCMSSDADIVKAMLECGAELNQKDPDGDNELMAVTRTRNKNGLEVAKVLLEAGVLMKMKNFQVRQGHQ